MCDRNIVECTHNHGGMPVETTANIDKTARTAREMAEAQRDSFEAIAENLAAAQRRGIGLAEGALEFMRLQEEDRKSTRLNSSHANISYAVFCLKKKQIEKRRLSTISLIILIAHY